MTNHTGGALTNLETLLPLLGIGYLVWNTMDKKQQSALLNQKVDPTQAAALTGQIRGGKSKRKRASRPKRASSKKRTRGPKRTKLSHKSKSKSKRKSKRRSTPH